ncbi:rhomboid family intramembrane serine protease [Gudongella sp. DL1XJH-153]|uniref:rhomboid family intramembrane serine protease n=1 Tax=Gudongella sp. DL1XJH-153 TaxID=3409804 RepID=UPI003BB490DD
MKEKIVEKYKESIRDGRGTLLTIFINIVLFIALNTIPSLREELLMSYEISMILEKPWTLITVFFSHEVYFHIIFNMALFFFFGLELEKITNTKTVISIYLVAGLLGSLTFLLTRSMIQPRGLIAGASAAVFGIVSAYAILRPNAVLLRSKAKLWVWALFIFSMLSATLHPQSLGSDVAHITGVAVGLICGHGLKNKEVKESK